MAKPATSVKHPGSDEEGPAPKKKRKKGKRFSMLRTFQVADLLTLANGFSGTAAIFSMMKYLVSGDRTYLHAVFALLPAALIFDVLDGRVARMRHEQSLLGQELDSLADLISFGVAPACLAFAVGMRGGVDAVALVYFVGCGLSRLARYNATAAELAGENGKVKYFEGTPIPSSLLIVAFLGYLVSQDKFGAALPLGVVALGPVDFHPLALVYAISGSAMISKTLHIPKP
jgi:CDP-diacylglycerol---serine O-phosphatidyltransferase